MISPLTVISPVTLSPLLPSLIYKIDQSSVRKGEHYCFAASATAAATGKASIKRRETANSLLNAGIVCRPRPMRPGVHPSEDRVLRAVNQCLTEPFGFTTLSSAMLLTLVAAWLAFLVFSSSELVKASLHRLTCVTPNSRNSRNDAFSWSHKQYQLL